MTSTPDPWGERLTRRLGLWSAIAVVIGSTIGSGIFRTPAAIAQRVDDVVLFLALWLIGGVLAVCGALTCGELGAMFPRSGGVYFFIRQGFGSLPAFLFGWAELLIIRPGAFGAIGITSSAYTLRSMGLDPAMPLFGVPVRGDQLLGAVFILIVAVVNYRGIHEGAVLQNLSTAFKTGALAALVVLGFALGHPQGLEAIASQRTQVGISAFLLALVSVLWAFDGFADLAFVGGEVRDPARNIPRALVLGTGAVVVLYLSANLVYLYLFPLAQIKQAELVAADVAQVVMGPMGIVAISAAVAVSTFGTLNGSMMTSPRIFFAMAEDGLFPRAIARVNPVTGSPTAAVALTTVLGVIFVMVRTFTELADQFIIGIWPFYALAVAAVFRLRRTQPDLPRPYRTWGYPVVPCLFLLGALLLLGNYLVSQPGIFALDIGVILTGVPVYYVWRRARSQ
jgi:amino acid transporter